MMNHNDFPKMTEEFDRSVRRALDSLPERESKPVRRFSAKKIVCAGLAAALCIGGTDGGQRQVDRRERALPSVGRIRAV